MYFISVIVPTVQKNLKIFYKLISLLNNDDAVDEIIIINNIQKSLPKKFNLSKVKIYNSKENMYVNGSWNVGISMIKNNVFLIINDDILPVENFCTKIMQTSILESNSTGLVGIDNNFICNKDKEDVTDIDIPNTPNNYRISFDSLDRHLFTGDWGSAFWGKKENYYQIPDDIKIIYGDNYLLYKNLNNNKKNYIMKGLPFNHIHSLSSSSHEYEKIVCNDCISAEKYMPIY